MIVFLNGKIVPEAGAVVSVFDRGFLYGDGLFETMRVVKGQPFLWDKHWERLTRGAEFIKISLPYSCEGLREFCEQLITQNQMPDCLLRLSLSRGIGPRGYSPRGADHPTVVMSLHPAPVLDPHNPPRWRLMTSTIRLTTNEPLAQFKTCNKLPQILARAQADAAGADEALLLNTDGHVVEGSSSNLFWLEDRTLYTPPLTSGVLPGVTRLVVLELAGGLGLETREAAICLEQLRCAGAVFLSLSSVGIAEASSLDGLPLQPSPVVADLHAAYCGLLAEAGK